MKKRMFFVLLALLLVFGGIFGFKAFQFRMMQQFFASQGAPTQTVSATEARASTWRPRLSAVATLEAVRGVDLATEVAGRVVAVEADDGADVEAGQVIVRLDPAVVAAALRGLRAQARLAELELQRQQRLREQRANSAADVDTAESRLEQARAAVEAQEAALAKRTIRAPFAGRLGIVEVDEGQFLDAGAMIVTLQTLDPMIADFTVPQRNLSRIGRGQPLVVTVDSYPERRFDGRISAISPKIAESTRNVAVRARLSNPDGLLRPGMFADVAVELPQQEDLVTLPQAAITYNPYGDSVFLIRESDDGDGGTRLTVERKFVRTGATRGDQVAILEGVAEGERVVTSGQLKLRNGSPVRIDNSIVPSSDPDPVVGNR